MPKKDYELCQLGECALRISFGDAADPALLPKIRGLMELLAKDPFPGYIECIPAYASLAIVYDPLLVADARPGRHAYATVAGIAEALLARHYEAELHGRAVEIPVCYGGEYGPDLGFVAQYAGLSEKEVVRIHTGGAYLVYMIGFSPGFPYLGGMDPRIRAPRRRTPRAAIPARSVGIAGNQTGAYPLSTPGGWQIIGRSAIELFRPEAQEPSLLRAGDSVRFRAVSEEEYLAIRRGDVWASGS